MIGNRSLVLRGMPIIAALVAGIAVGAGGDPGAMLAAERLVETRAREAAAELDALATALAPAREEARRGVARVVSGRESPAEALGAAADIVDDAAQQAASARAAVSALNATRDMAPDDAPDVTEPPGPEDLHALAGELRASASAAEAFAERRRSAARVVETLDAALQSLVEGRPSDAADAVTAARADHAALLSWPREIAILSIWLETTDAMISAVETLIDASRGGDDERAAAAARDFAALSGEAAIADRALRIAVGEGGGAVTAPALERFGAVTAAIEGSRSSVTALLGEEGR